MSTKVKMPKAPVQPGFHLTKPVPPKGQPCTAVAWSFDNEQLDSTSLNFLNAKVTRCIQDHHISGEYTATIHQTYASSEYGHCEFELRVNYFNNNPTQEQIKSYEKELEKYNKAKEKHDKEMEEYKIKKAAYDKEIEEIKRKAELELLAQLVKKHGIPQSIITE